MNHARRTYKKLHSFIQIASLWLRIIAGAMMQAKKDIPGFRSDPRLLPRIRDVSFMIF